MLISSPPFGPFSFSHISPVTGCMARPSALRWPEGIHLGLRARLSRKRVIRRNASVVSDAEDLAALVAGVLREVRILLVAAGRRHVEHAVFAERDARRAGRVEDEDVFDVGECLAVEARARDGDRAALVVERFRVPEIQEFVLGKLWMERDVHVAVHGTRQSGLTGEVACRSAGYRLGIEHAVAHHAQLTGAFGDEHRAVGCERDRPREFQCLRHHHDADALTLAGVELHRLVRQRPVGEASRCDRDASLERHRLLAGADGQAHGGGKSQGEWYGKRHATGNPHG